MEATETINDGSIEAAVESIIAPIEEEKVEATEEVAQATEETAEVEDTAVEEPAESEEVEALDSDEDSDEEITYEASELDEDNDQVEDAGHTELESYSVKIDGQEVQVTLDDLKQGYSGQKYVQKGMQDAAKQKKEAEAVYQALLNERQQITNLYEQLQQGGVSQAPVPPSRDLLETDPIGYMEAKLNYDEDQAYYDNQMQQLQGVAQQNAYSQKMSQQEYIRKEMNTLKQKIPEFGNATSAAKMKDRIVKVGQEAYGYTAQEIGQVTDHRAIQVLYDAARYQEIMSGKNKAVAKTTKGKPVMKSGAKKVSDSKTKVRKRQQAKLQKSGSINDALGLILNT